MTYELLLHPLASYCWKACIAFHESGLPFEARTVDLGDPAQRAELAALWPFVKIPVLRDHHRGVVVAEVTLIIEHLARHEPSARTLVPLDPDAAFEARKWDRILDLYVHEPMQKIVFDHLRPEAERDAASVRSAKETLAISYRLLEGQLAGRSFLTGEAFTLADCAALPALFYASHLVPLHGHPALAAYLVRLRQRPSVVRVIDGARPFFQHFPVPGVVLA